MLLFEIRTFPTPPTLRLLFEPEQYFFSLLEIYCFRVGLCHLRLPIISCLNLDCVFCVNATENEEHLLFICPLYSDVRVKRLYDTHLNVVTVSLLKCSLGKSRSVFSLTERGKEFAGQTSFALNCTLRCTQLTGFTCSLISFYL